MLTKQKTRADFDYQLELMQRLILSYDLFQKTFLIFTPQARKVYVKFYSSFFIDYPKQKKCHLPKIYVSGRKTIN